MFLQHRDADKLQVLLSRFVDQEILTTEIVYKTSKYLFFKCVGIPPVGNKTLRQALIYLKDLMEVNDLMTVDDILFYYQRRRASLRLYMQRTIESSKVELYEPAPAQSAILLDWTLSELPKALPPSSSRINVCFANSCAIQITSHLRDNPVLSYRGPYCDPIENTKRMVQDKEENEVVY